jgi:iron complex transport system substrate-binding protein
VRIVSLLPSATEILFDIGAGGDVVGVTHECDFPEAAKALPHLTSSALPHAGTPSEIDRHVRKSLHEGSSLYYLNSELLEKLAPDLIVTQELCAVCAVSYSIVDRAARRLSSDPRIVSLEPSSLEDVYANIETVGRLTGRETGAQELVESLQLRIAALQQRVAGLPKQRVLVLEWTEPPMSGGHWAPQLVEIAGGSPVLGNPGGNSQVLTWKQIADADPDVIIVAPCGFDLEKTQDAVSRLSAVSEWNELRAVRAGNVTLVDGNAYLNRPGPRLVDTTEIFAGVLHPVTVSN